MIRDSSKMFEVKDMEQSDENDEELKTTTIGSRQRTVACNSSLGKIKRFILGTNGK